MCCCIVALIKTATFQVLEVVKKIDQRGREGSESALPLGGPPLPPAPSQDYMLRELSGDNLLSTLKFLL